MRYKDFRRLSNSQKASETMLDYLKKEPKSATELARDVGLRRATVSQYLNELYRRNLVEKVYWKRQIYYGIKEKQPKKED